MNFNYKNNKNDDNGNSNIEESLSKEESKETQPTKKNPKKRPLFQLERSREKPLFSSDKKLNIKNLKGFFEISSKGIFFQKKICLKF